MLLCIREQVYIDAKYEQFVNEYDLQLLTQVCLQVIYYLNHGTDFSIKMTKVSSILVHGIC